MAHPLSRKLCQPKVNQVFICDGRKFTLRGALGDGAAGIVRKAVAHDSDTVVAVKFLAPDPKYIDEGVFDDVAHRFRREGERGLSLRHPHLVEVIAYAENVNGEAFSGGSPGNPLIVMEYVDGNTLERHILRTTTDRGKFLVDRPRLNMAIQLASALRYLRDKRLIHRDVKPTNVFLSKTDASSEIPHAQIGDFGVMKWGDFQASVSTGVLTVTSQKGLGTLKYMSPEQALRPKDVTVKSDVYSLGITLFELFTRQVLASPHHIYEIANARRARGNTLSRFAAIEVPLRVEDEGIASLILDMFLAANGRPSIDTISGRLEWEYEHRFGEEWDSDLH